MALSVPRLETCCCGCTLRTGTLILLYLSVFGSLSTIFGPKDTLQQEKTNKEMEKLAPTVTAYSIFTLVASVIALYGTHANISWAVMPYIVLKAIGNLCFLILIVITLFIIPPLAFVFLIILLLECYFWLVVYNYNRELKEGKISSPA